MWRCWIHELFALREVGFLKSGTLSKSIADHPGKGLTRMRYDGYFSCDIENSMKEAI